MSNQWRLATRLRKYSHEISNTILASVSVSLSTPVMYVHVVCMYNIWKCMYNICICVYRWCILVYIYIYIKQKAHTVGSNCQIIQINRCRIKKKYIFFIEILELCVMLFLDSLMNRKFKRTTLIWNSNILYGVTITFDKFNASLLNKVTFLMNNNK